VRKTAIANRRPLLADKLANGPRYPAMTFRIHPPAVGQTAFSTGGLRQAPGPSSTISMRRFFVRPSGVSFDATGCVSPNPLAEMMFGLTPCDVR
jgi:hypothetical protein